MKAVAARAFACKETLDLLSPLSPVGTRLPTIKSERKEKREKERKREREKERNKERKTKFQRF